MPAANTEQQLVSQLFEIRNQFGADYKAQKLELVQKLSFLKITSAKIAQHYYDCLLFLIAYPDDRVVFDAANIALRQLDEHIFSNQKLSDKLFNSGVTGSAVCAAFSFELVKWLRKNRSDDITLDSIDADDGQITYVISALIPKVESEIMQDANAEWKGWLKKWRSKDEEALDSLIAVFDETDVRPEVKDELWNALGINVVVNLSSHCCLATRLYEPHFHTSLQKKVSYDSPEISDAVPVKMKLTAEEDARVIDCARMILIRHIREIDPVTFTDIGLVSYYQLAHGISIALFGMKPERRHPIDSYMGYVAFKNGLPVGYAGSWILFDSGRIALNIFPSFRGGESLFAFHQILHLHQKVYNLNRFSVDPYQIGKDNDDGILSGAFWVYHHMGFRPIKAEQKKIAEQEYAKIKSQKGYRTPAPVLRKLADSRLELFLNPKAVGFDATDLSVAYVALVKERFNNNRKAALDFAYPRVAKLLGFKESYRNGNTQFILKNWSPLLIDTLAELKKDAGFRKLLKEIFELKANGSEEKFITALQRSKKLRTALEKLVIRQN